MRRAFSLLGIFVLAGLISCEGCNDSGGNSPGHDAGITIDEDCTPDTDGDGICDSQEVEIGTDPNNADSDGDGLSDGAEVAAGIDPLSNDTDGDGILDGDEAILGTDPGQDDAACAGRSAQANSGEAQPADIILTIDSSGSMVGEIFQVEENISTSFAEIIGNANIDYRVILLADYPPGQKETICIREPLSTDDCEDPLPDAPGDNERFHHYDTLIDSHDAFDQLINRFGAPDVHGLAPGGWSDWLRPEALKVFLMISDDDPDKTAQWFDQSLLNLPGGFFGTPSARNYIFHSIIGMAENTPPEEPWTPFQALVEERCEEGSESSAEEYQRLSILTGGLRFPLCNNDNFDVIFEAIAQGVIEQVYLPCRFEAPPAPPGEEINLDAVVLVYHPGDDSPARSLTRVSGANACAPDAFYVTPDGSAIMLCPQTCTAVQGDAEGGLELHVGCGGTPPVVEPPDAGPPVVTTCESCEDCNGQACNDGECGGCINHEDCCEGLLCIQGTCLSPDG